MYLCLKSTHFICVAPIYKPHIVCSDGDGPDAINFTIKYMMGGGGEWPDAKPLA